MEPTILGIPLVSGMEIGDDVPDCCDEEMTTRQAALAHHSHREYQCTDCGTVVEVDDLDLVYDIRETQTA